MVEKKSGWNAADNPSHMIPNMMVGEPGRYALDVGNGVNNLDFTNILQTYSPYNPGGPAGLKSNTNMKAMSQSNLFNTDFMNGMFQAGVKTVGPYQFVIGDDGTKQVTNLLTNRTYNYGADVTPATMMRDMPGLEQVWRQQYGDNIIDSIPKGSNAYVSSSFVGQQGKKAYQQPGSQEYIQYWNAPGKQSTGLNTPNSAAGSFNPASTGGATLY